MSRPAGVTASAVVAILGGALAATASAFALLLTLSHFGPLGDPANHLEAIAYGLGFVLGGLGIIAGVGVLRVRPWARVLMIVFAATSAGAWVAWGAPMLGMPLLGAPIPRLAYVWGAGFLVGVWWLVQFNTQAVRDAFAAGGLAPPFRSYSAWGYSGPTPGHAWEPWLGSDTYSPKRC